MVATPVMPDMQAISRHRSYGAGLKGSDVDMPPVQSDCYLTRLAY
jgi:hypothetical protein